MPLNISARSQCSARNKVDAWLIVVEEWTRGQTKWCYHPLEQCVWHSFLEVMECSISVLSYIAVTSYMWQLTLTMWLVLGTKFLFLFNSNYLNLNSHIWLLTTTLDSTVQDFYEMVSLLMHLGLYSLDEFNSKTEHKIPFCISFFTGDFHPQFFKHPSSSHFTSFQPVESSLLLRVQLQQSHFPHPLKVA